MYADDGSGLDTVTPEMACKSASNYLEKEMGGVIVSSLDKPDQWPEQLPLYLDFGSVFPIFDGTDMVVTDTEDPAHSLVLKKGTIFPGWFSG